MDAAESGEKATETAPETIHIDPTDITRPAPRKDSIARTPRVIDDISDAAAEIEPTPIQHEGTAADTQTKESNTPTPESPLDALAHLANIDCTTVTTRDAVLKLSQLLRCGLTPILPGIIDRATRKDKRPGFDYTASWVNDTGDGIALSVNYVGVGFKVSQKATRRLMRQGAAPISIRLRQTGLTGSRDPETPDIQYIESRNILLRFDTDGPEGPGLVEATYSTADADSIPGTTVMEARTRVSAKQNGNHLPIEHYQLAAVALRDVAAEVLNRFHKQPGPVPTDSLWARVRSRLRKR